MEMNEIELEDMPFSDKEVISKIIETLENNEDMYGSDLHIHAFNEDYYVIGTAQAESCIDNYGMRKSLKEIEEYEKSNFGESNMSRYIDNPEIHANMIFYIKGEEFINNHKGVMEILSNAWDRELTKEESEKMIEILKKEL